MVYDLTAIDISKEIFASGYPESPWQSVSRTPTVALRWSQSDLTSIKAQASSVLGILIPPDR
jgi:hypothetical protein